MRNLALLWLVLLTSCATRDLPFAVERGGTLPLDQYPALEQLAAQAKPVVRVVVTNNAVGLPEPYWVYAVDPGLDLTHTSLQVAQFTSTNAKGKAADTAASLRQRLVEKLADSHLFANVGTAPSPGGLVLSGAVTRATTDSDGLAEIAYTQVEASLTRGGTVVGVMQVNTAQLDSSLRGGLLIPLYSLIQGSRASYVSGKFEEIFKGVAAGRNRGIDTDTIGQRFVRAPTDLEWPPPPDD